jgi:hypothetical protein
LAFLACVAISSCKNHPFFNGDYTRIEVGPGPEDIALDTSYGMERLIISCSERRLEDYSRNGFYGYHIQSRNLVKLPMEELPDSIQFRPHGIDIGLVNGKRILFCVNHENNAEDYPPKGRQSILIFELLEDKVVYREQLTDSILNSPNDVCIDHKGGIYVSNDSGSRNNSIEKLFELRRSTVIHYDGVNWKYVGDKFKYANGVGVRNNRLFVTGTQEELVASYRIMEDGNLAERINIPSMKGNDNITFSNGKLVTTAHLDFMKFLKHFKDEDKPSPCAVYSIDINTHVLDTMYLDNGTVLSTASTGLVYNGNLYVSQVFNPFILEIPLDR